MASLITLVDGTIPVASDFNSNFTALNAEIRPYNTGGTGQSSYAKGDIIIAAAANSLTRLTLGVQGTVLSVLSTGIPGWAGPALYKSGTDITISNSTTETSLLNGSASPGPYSLLANTLSTANRVRIVMVAKGTNTAGAGAKTFTFKLKYGATTLCTKALSVANGLTDTPIFLQAELMADALTNAQLGTMLTLLTAVTVDEQVGTSAIDSTAAGNLDVTMTLQTASASIAFTMQYVMVELVA